MKIIFENEEEKKAFRDMIADEDGICPGQIGLCQDYPCLGPNPKICSECWENSGIETEVKGESDSTDELKARLERLRDFFFMICTEDWDEMLHEAYGQCVLAPEDITFLCEIEEKEEEKRDPDRTVKKKPPLGIMPRYLWERKRCREIAEAIDQYTYAEKPIPNEWVEEYNELVEKGTDRIG